jgi:hypothetical protein
MIACTTACNAGSYSGDAASLCSSCPGDSSSTAGAASCVCNAGYVSTGFGSSLVCSCTLHRMSQKGKCG